MPPLVRKPAFLKSLVATRQSSWGTFKRTVLVCQDISRNDESWPALRSYAHRSIIQKSDGEGTLSWLVTRVPMDLRQDTGWSKAASQIAEHWIAAQCLQQLLLTTDASIHISWIRGGKRLSTAKLMGGCSTLRKYSVKVVRYLLKKDKLRWGFVWTVDLLLLLFSSGAPCWRKAHKMLPVQALNYSLLQSLCLCRQNGHLTSLDVS